MCGHTERRTDAGAPHSLGLVLMSWLQVAAYIKSHFGFEYSMRGWIVLILLGFVVVFRVCAIIGVTKLTFVKR